MTAGYYGPSYPGCVKGTDDFTGASYNCSAVRGVVGVLCGCTGVNYGACPAGHLVTDMTPLCCPWPYQTALSAGPALPCPALHFTWATHSQVKEREGRPAQPCHPITTHLSVLPPTPPPMQAARRQEMAPSPAVPSAPGSLPGCPATPSTAAASTTYSRAGSWPAQPSGAWPPYHAAAALLAHLLYHPAPHHRPGLHHPSPRHQARPCPPPPLHRPHRHHHGCKCRVGASVSVDAGNSSAQHYPLLGCCQ
jgi:hypothetical protein